MFTGTTPASRRVMAGERAGATEAPSAAVESGTCWSCCMLRFCAGAAGAAPSTVITAISLPMSTTSSTLHRHSLSTPAMEDSIG